MRKTVVIAMLLVMALSATAVFGQAAGGDRQRPRTGGMGLGSCPAAAVMPPPATIFETNAADLQLTTEQLTKLKDILSKSNDKTLPLMRKANEGAQAIRTALMASPYDAEKVKKLAADATKNEADLIAARLEAWTGIRTTLTADQITKLQELMAEQRGRPAADRQRNRPGAGGTAPAPPPPAPPAGQ